MTKEWTREEMAAGYQAMAELNLALAHEFAPLEEEAALICDERLAIND